jgi:hypothetical protein
MARAIDSIRENTRVVASEIDRVGSGIAGLDVELRALRSGAELFVGRVSA